MSVSDRFWLIFFAMMVIGPCTFHYFKASKVEPAPVVSNKAPEPPSSIKWGKNLDCLMSRCDDDEIKQAVRDAQASIGDFIKALDRPYQDTSEFSVKVAIAHDASRKNKCGNFAWISPVQYKDGAFYGLVRNKISNGPLNAGDPVIVRENHIADWKYIEGGFLVGGFTYRVLRNRLSPSKRMELDNRMGVHIRPCELKQLAKPPRRPEPEFFEENPVDNAAPE